MFVTHSPSDHIGGIGSFPTAGIYATEATAGTIRRRYSRGAEGLGHGAQVTVSGTEVEMVALPGRTRGCAACMGCGVPLLRDSGVSIHDASVLPNRYLSKDPQGTEESLAALALKLQHRLEAAQHIALGHHRPLSGPASLIAWASDRRPR